MLAGIMHGVRNGIRADSSLAWVLDSERVSTVAPGVARGVGFAEEAPFLQEVLPRIASDSRVLELGCGDGRIARHVGPLAREVLCTDVSRTMVREARQNLSALSNVSVARVPRTTLRGLEDASFDVVLAQGVLSYLDVNHAVALLDEAHRVLAFGGVLIANLLTIDRPAWRLEQLRRVREGARRGHFGGGTAKTICERQAEAMVEAVGFDLISTGYGAEPADRRLPYIVVGRRGTPAVSPS